MRMVEKFDRIYLALDASKFAARFVKSRNPSVVNFPILMNNKVSSILARVTALALIASPICCLELRSQEVYSQIVGAIALNIPKESDLVVSFPFKRSASFRGDVVGAPTSNSFNVVANSLTQGEFGPSHYVYVEDGVLRGRRFDIVSNTASSVTVDASTLNGLGVGDKISIREHWTLDEAFPQGIASVTVAEAGLREIELIVPDRTSVGGGIAANRVFYFYKGAAEAAAWREVGKALNVDVGDTIIEPGTAFVVRNNSEAVRTYFFGEVVTAPLAIPVVSADDSIVDNFVAIERPLGIALPDLGLTSGVFAPSTGQTPETRGDLLRVYSPTAGKKISNEVIEDYYLFNGTWYAAANNAVATTVKVAAGMGIAIRKKSTVSDATTFWVNDWSLPQ